MASRVLTQAETDAFLKRQFEWYAGLVAGLYIPEQGYLIKDPVLGCVLFFQKTDGTRLLIQTDSFANCQMSPAPSVVDQILDALLNPLDTLTTALKYIRNAAIIAAVLIVLVLVLQSGLLRDLKPPR